VVVDPKEKNAPALVLHKRKDKKTAKKVLL
jgi:hypothetical protein